MRITRTDEYGDTNTFVGVREVTIYEYGERFNMIFTLKDNAMRLASNNVTDIIVEAEEED